MTTFATAFREMLLAKGKQAEIAQLVEHDLAKVGVAGSSPVFRSTFWINIFLNLTPRWRNWQTRTFQVRVFHNVQVRVLFWAQVYSERHIQLERWRNWQTRYFEGVVSIVTWEFESPPLHLFFQSFIAEIAQLVEHDLAKVGVAGSSPVFRSQSKKEKYTNEFILKIF